MRIKDVRQGLHTLVHTQAGRVAASI